MRIGIIGFSAITATEKLISDNGYLMIWPLRCSINTCPSSEPTLRHE